MTLPKLRKSTKIKKEKKKTTSCGKVPRRTPWDWIEDIYCSTTAKITTSFRVNDVVEIEQNDTLRKGTIVAVVPVLLCHEIEYEKSKCLLRVRYDSEEEDDEWFEGDSNRIHKSSDDTDKKKLLASPLREPLALAKQMSRLGVSSKVGNESRLRTCVSGIFHS